MPQAAAKAGPPGPGGAGSAQLPRGCEVVKVIVFFQYDLVSLCFNQKCVSFAWFGGVAGP